MQRDFPNLHQGVNWHPDSDATAEYNCLAWAVWSTQDVIWPDPAGLVQWDPTLPANDAVHSIEGFLEKVGFKHCGGNPDFVNGIEKVAIYALPGGSPQHVARQVVTGARAGQWTSKMGPGVDVFHNNLQVLEGPTYGTVVSIWARKFSGPPILPPLHPRRPKLIRPDGGVLF